MKILGLDTSGDACSAALLADGVMTQRLERAPRRHGELILGMFESLLEERNLTLPQLDAIAFSRGPGSFTGVRIAVAVAQGLSLGRGVPTIPVSTLAALAQGGWRRARRHRVIAALDARMGELYWGSFELGSQGLMVPLGEERVCPPGEVPLPPGKGWWGLGPGWSAHGEILSRRLAPLLDGVCTGAICEAQDIVQIAQLLATSAGPLPPGIAQPVYLRDRVTDRG